MDTALNTYINLGASIDDFALSIEQAKNDGELQTVETPIIHYHTKDLYGRRIVVPTGSVFTTRVHKSDHISVMLRGRITIVDQDGNKADITAPDAFVTKQGTHRVVYVHDEVEFMTVHHCEEQDDDKVEDVLGCRSMAEYNALQIEAQV